MPFWGLSKVFRNATLVKKKLIDHILSGEIFLEMYLGYREKNEE